MNLPWGGAKPQANPYQALLSISILLPFTSLFKAVPNLVASTIPVSFDVTPGFTSIFTALVQALVI